jgi:hypothetical protein
VNKEEWEKADPETRPAIRFCVSAEPGSLTGATPTSVIQQCSWCGGPVWVELAQELPHEARERGLMPVCSACGMQDEEMAVAVLRNLFEVYEHWVETGVTKAIKFGEDEEKG